MYAHSFHHSGWEPWREAIVPIAWNNNFSIEVEVQENGFQVGLSNMIYRKAYCRDITKWHIQVSIETFFRDMFYHRAPLEDYYLITITGDHLLIHDARVEERMNVKESYDYSETVQKDMGDAEDEYNDSAEATDEYENDDTIEVY